MASLTLAICLIQGTKCDRSESDDTADLARRQKKACLDPLLQGSWDNIGDQGRADYRRIILGPCYCRCMWGPIELFLTLIAAAATALLLGLIAHVAMGMPIDMIRIDALGAAGLIFAVVAGGSLLRRKR